MYFCGDGLVCVSGSVSVDCVAGSVEKVNIELAVRRMGRCASAEIQVRSSRLEMKEVQLMMNESDREPTQTTPSPD